MIEKPKGKAPTVIKSYSKGIEERAAARREERPKIGNLAEANVLYKPGRDGPMTVAEAARRTTAMGTAGSGDQRLGALSPATIAGMESLAKEVTRLKQQKESSMSEATAPQVVETKPITASTPMPPSTDTKAADKKTAQAIDELDELELERLMRNIQTDVINNKEEQRHVDDVTNNRITEIDFAAGIATGEFTQVVDVIPKLLKVHYRTVSPMENQALRLWIFSRTSADPRIDAIKGEMFGLGLIVLAVTQIGSTKFTDHLTRSGSGVYGSTFNDEAFSKKYDQFARMPQQLIHSVGTHASWFDLRIRRMFTTDYAKNG